MLRAAEQIQVAVRMQQRGVDVAGKHPGELRVIGRG